MLVLVLVLTCLSLAGTRSWMSGWNHPDTEATARTPASISKQMHRLTRSRLWVERTIAILAGCHVVYTFYLRRVASCSSERTGHKPIRWGDDDRERHGK